VTLALLLGLALAQLAPAPGTEIPREFVQRVRDAIVADFAIQEQFTYLERRRDVKMSRLGKITIGPLRTFEVRPSQQPGRTYKRLIAVDGKPLTPGELAERDAEHARDLKKAAERTSDPTERAERLAEEARDQHRRDAILADAMAVFRPTYVGRETISGRNVIVADVAPREDAQVTTREGRWAKRFAGRIWVDAANYQIVRIHMRAIEDVTIGWGIIGRLHAGSRILIERQLIDEVWLPASVTYEASGRTMLFRTFKFNVTTTYSDYRRIDGTR
jgi:hypothetical protein